MRRDGDKKMSKILSEKQKEALMWARKSGKTYDLMQARKNSNAYSLAEIIKKSKDVVNAEAKEMDPLENWHAGVEAATELFRGSDDADLIARAKAAAVFGNLLDMGLDPKDLEAVVKKVNGDE